MSTVKTAAIRFSTFKEHFLLPYKDLQHNTAEK